MAGCASRGTAPEWSRARSSRVVRSFRSGFASMSASPPARGCAAPDRRPRAVAEMNSRRSSRRSSTALSLGDQHQLVVVGHTQPFTGRPRGACLRCCSSTPSTFQNPPSVASTFPDSIAGSRLAPTLVSFTEDFGHVRAAEDRLEIGGLVRDPRRADALPAQVLHRADAGRAGRHQRRQRPLDHRRDRHHRQPALAGEQHLRLVGDRHVGPAGRHLLDRRRGVGGARGFTSRPTCW